MGRALRAGGLKPKVLSWRKGLPRTLGRPDLILICVRDEQIRDVTQMLLRLGLPAATVIAHVSGVQGPEILGSLRSTCRGVAQFHPFSSIRSVGRRDFHGTHFLATGDTPAIRILGRVARQLGATLVRGEHVDRARYHLAAALLANGSVALLHAAAQLLQESGIEAKKAVPMLLDLQRSVIDNATRLGIPAALTGPVRRGDVATIRAHVNALRGAAASTRELYRTIVEAQIEIVRKLDDVEPAALANIRRLVMHALDVSPAASAPTRSRLS